MGPAGTADMLDRFRAVGGVEHRAVRVLPRSSSRKLFGMHTPIVEIPPKPDAPPGTPSAGATFGWLTMKVPLSREPFLFHGGSNQMNLANVLIQPKYDFAIVAMTNIGGRRADEALKALAGQLYKKASPRRSRSPRKRSRVSGACSNRRS